MGNLYCTNCGTESTKKICNSCGVKRNTVHKYCAYCGTELTPNASICTNCKESVKESFLGQIPSLVVAIFILRVLFAAIEKEQTISSIICLLICFILCLPKIKTVIKNATIGKKGLRRILNLGRIVAIIAIFIIALNNGRTLSLYERGDEATIAAEKFFHEEVQLKNESSYVLNDSSVVWGGSAEGSSWVEVQVTLDYSAENSFGGTNRNTYTVKMLYNKETGQYVRN